CASTPLTAAPCGRRRPILPVRGWHGPCGPLPASSGSARTAQETNMSRHDRSARTIARWALALAAALLLTGTAVAEDKPADKKERAKAGDGLSDAAKETLKKPDEQRPI